MKNILFIFLFISLNAAAQDTIVRKDGDKICCVVLRLTEDSIHYNRTGSQKAFHQFISKSDVSFIKYKSQYIQNIDSLLDVSRKIKELTDGLSREELFVMGKLDASRYFSFKGCVGYATFMTLAGGPFGVAALLRRIDKAPDVLALNYPSEDLWKNRNYREGYKYRAIEIKRRAVRKGIWTGFTAGSVVIMGFAALAVISNLE